jgi:hypothetical protein
MSRPVNFKQRFQFRILTNIHVVNMDEEQLNTLVATSVVSRPNNGRSILKNFMALLAANAAAVCGVNP